MADIMMPFSIHQELWHDCWVAATTAARAHKKLVDYVISKRVARLLQDYGPESGQPLTLRVYGTMLKGFCVLNNERAKALYGDCERIVIAFAQQPYADGSSVKLPVAKRQRVDALTLDLDLAKVQESEAFDWGPAPVEDGALLAMHLEPATLEEPVPEFMPEMALLRMPSVLEQAPLLDEAFPALEAPALESLSLPGETSLVSAVAEPAGAQPPVARNILQLLGAAPEPAMPDPGALVVCPPRPLVLIRRPRGFSNKPLGPGVVYGFDERTQLAPDTYSSWLEADGELSHRYREPADFAESLQTAAARVEHLGQLVDLLDPPHPRLGDTMRPGVQHPLLCEQMLPLAEQQQQAMTGAGTEGGPLVPTGAAAAARQSSLMEFFRPYEPEDPLASTQGAGEELAGILGPQSSSGGGDEALAEAAAAGYDSSAVQVGRVLRECLARGAGEHRGLTLDDLVPANRTTKTVAARTFWAVLTLATAGDFCAEQLQPYGAIGISAA